MVFGTVKLEALVPHAAPSCFFGFTLEIFSTDKTSIDVCM
jgi:hypothetical protein